MLKTLTGTLALALAVLSATSAHAAELVKNGDFEGSILGQNWTIDSSGGYGPTGIFGEWGAPGTTGKSAVLAGYNGATESISQTIDTAGYSSAILSFDLTWITLDIPDYDFLDVYFGSEYLGYVDLGSFDPVDIVSDSFTVDLTPYFDGTSKVLKFEGINDDFPEDEGTNDFASPAFLDNVSIQAQPVPEPASLMAIGLGTAAVLRRRCRA